MGWGGGGGGILHSARRSGLDGCWLATAVHHRRIDLRGLPNAALASQAFTTGSLTTCGNVGPPTVEWTAESDALLRKAVEIFGDGGFNPRAMSVRRPSSSGIDNLNRCDWKLLWTGSIG
eukprot:SAG31_NODE_3111_length_4662_cov_82.023230_6_plen_119_part_00